jgi:hypothetical protein
LENSLKLKFLLFSTIFFLSFNLTGGTTQWEEELLPRPIGRPANFDCYANGWGTLGAKPIPHYVDWDQDGFLEKQSILLCESSSLDDVDFGPNYVMSSSSIVCARNSPYGCMYVVHLFPVPVYKTTAMNDFEFDCDPEDGKKFQMYYTLGPDADGDGIPTSLSAQEICTGDTAREGYYLTLHGFDPQNKAIDWRTMRSNLNTHSLLGPTNSQASGVFKSFGFKGFSYWQFRWSRIQGGGQWGYASGYGNDPIGLTDCDDSDPLVPYGALYKDTDKDTYPDTLQRFTCYDPYFISGKSWFNEVDLAKDSLGNLLRPTAKWPPPSIVDCAPNDPEVFEDCCSDLETAEGRMKVFKSGFNPSNYSNDGSGGMVLNFAPMCSDGKPVQVKHLAKSFGFDHFNWWNSMSNKYAVTYTVSENTLVRLYTETNPSFSSAAFNPEADLWVIDPVLNRKGFYVVAALHPETGERVGIGLLKDGEEDNFPYYWKEGAEVQSQTTKYTLKFSDYPYMSPDWFTELKQAPTEFKTRVAGVKKDGTFVFWSVEHKWRSTNGFCGEDGCAKSRPFTITAKNPSPPPGWENRTGEVIYDGVSGLDIIVTPDLVGKPSDAVTISKFLSGSGFTMKVIGYQSSSTVPEGVVISQTPEQLSEVSVRGEIQVVVSTGNNQNCGDIMNGQTTTRTRYMQAEIAFGGSCDEVKEVQTGTCTNGTLVFDGTAAFEACTVKAPESCGAIPHGGAATRSMYTASSVPFGTSCESVREEQEGSCDNGNLVFNGTATFNACTVAEPASCGAIPHGGTTARTMYLSPSVAFGSSCDSIKEEQIGTCFNGSLNFNGTATFNSCDVAEPASCGSIPHGGTTSRTMYSAPEVLFGESCDAVKENQTGNCYNGDLSYSGTAQYESCKVLPPIVVGCEKVKTKVCKAHLLGTKTCKIPGPIVSVEVDRTYKGTKCHQAPVVDDLWDLIKLVNSYSYTGDKLKVYYGCDAKFKVKYIGNCRVKD